MGSLMAGWDSPVPDPRDVKYRRNKSLTKEEIEAFWKSKKRKEEEHLRDISLLSPRSQKIIYEDAKRRNIRASSDPLPTTATTEDMDNDTNLEKLLQKNGWWISSNWAFLNEPPVIGPNGNGHKYASQFHVTNTNGSTKPHDQTGMGA